MNYVEVELLTGEVLIVDEDDYEKIKDFQWEARVYRSQGGSSIFICRVDNRRIRLHHVIGYADIWRKNIEITFINENIFDYRKSNIILQKRWKDVPEENRKRPKTNFDRNRDSGHFKNEYPIPENGCVIKNARIRHKMCVQCDITDNVKWKRCLDVACEMFWTQWQPKEKGEWCLQMEKQYKNKGGK